MFYWIGKAISADKCEYCRKKIGKNKRVLVGGYNYPKQDFRIREKTVCIECAQKKGINTQATPVVTKKSILEELFWRKKKK